MKWEERINNLKEIEKVISMTKCSSSVGDKRILDISMFKLKE
jgi:hypothetical protein